MKLRNKLSGEIIDFDIVVITKYHESLISRISNNIHVLYCRSIEQLNSDWEDYTPKEPLIKDEKIRKVVRAWAEANDITEINVASSGYELWGGIDDWCIHFRGNPFKDIKPLKYTIAELCGEEEEYYMIKENK